MTETQMRLDKVRETSAFRIWNTTLTLCVVLTLVSTQAASAAEKKPTSAASPFRLAAAPFDAFNSEPVQGDLEFSTTGPEAHADREKYPHIYSTDVDDPNRFWYTERKTILQATGPDNFDPMKLINTDRPDFTDVATVVGKGVSQFETGWTYRYHSDPSGGFQRNTLPDVLCRVGVSDKFEWRFRWDAGYTNTVFSDAATNQRQEVAGYSDVVVGFKRILFDQDDWMPLQSVVTRLSIPTGSYEYSAQTVQPGFSYIYNWQVRRWWFFRGSSGCDWLHSASPVFAPVGLNTDALPIASYQRGYNVQGSQSISSYVQISQRVGMYAEWFMFYHSGLQDNRPDHFHNYGWYLYLTPNLQLDARIGWRVGGTIDEYFTGAGISWRRERGENSKPKRRDDS